MVCAAHSAWNNGLGSRCTGLKTWSPNRSATSGDASPKMAPNGVGDIAKTGRVLPHGGRQNNDAVAW
eukprot:4620877-Lingulodinium_polyedra.AAC.1